MALLVAFCFAFPAAVVIAWLVTSWWFWAVLATALLLKIAIDAIEVIEDRIAIRRYRRALKGGMKPWWQRS